MREAFIDALDQLYDAMGDDAKHVNRDGEYRDCKVIYEVGLERYGEAAEVNAVNATLRVRRKDLKEQPRRGECFILGTAEYKVAQISQTDDLEYSVFVG